LILSLLRSLIRPVQLVKTDPRNVVIIAACGGADKGLAADISLQLPENLFLKIHHFLVESSLRRNRKAPRMKKR